MQAVVKVPAGRTVHTEIEFHWVTDPSIFILWNVVYVKGLSNSSIKSLKPQNSGISLVNLKIRLFFRINQNIAFLHELESSVEKEPKFSCLRDTPLLNLLSIEVNNKPNILPQDKPAEALLTVLSY